MKLATLFLTVAASLTLAMTAGCGVQYNGAVSLNPVEVEQANGDQERNAGQTSAKSAHSAMPSKSTASQPGVQYTEAGPKPINGSQYVSTHRDPDVSSLTLYGQLPGKSQGVASPLDSPRNISQITFANEGGDFDPVIDPKGQWLAFASTRHRKTSDIYLQRIGGSAVKQLTADKANDVMPAFSPDGRMIAFASNRSGTWSIYLQDIVGGQPIKLTNDDADDIHPSFSRDGQTLVYSTLSSNGGQWEIALIDIEQPNVRKIIGHGLFPHFSSVDDRIVFQRARQRGTRWFSIWTIELVNGEPTPPTEVVSARNAATITPRFSPDGKFIVFSTVTRTEFEQKEKPKQADVWIVGSNGIGRVNLTQSHHANLQPVWAKDQTIFFVSNRAKDGIENIWSIRPERVQSLVNSTMGVGNTATAGASPKKMTTPKATDGTTAEVPTNP